MNHPQRSYHLQCHRNLLVVTLQQALYQMHNLTLQILLSNLHHAKLHILGDMLFSLFNNMIRRLFISWTRIHVFTYVIKGGNLASNFSKKGLVSMKMSTGNMVDHLKDACGCG